MAARCIAGVVIALTACGGGGDEVVPDAPIAIDSSIDAPPREAVIHASCTGTGSGPRVLVFTKENLWMHPSTPIARDALLAMCTTRGFSVTASADEKVFDRVYEYDVAVFAVTSGIVLDERSRLELEAWVRAGGGVVGIHSASATELEWPFFAQLLGARFRTHPADQLAGDLTVEDATHPITSGVPVRQNRVDEWYAFHERPEQNGYHMLLALDETTVALPPDNQSGFHPVAWTDDRHGGRMFYTSLGHMTGTYTEQWFLDMLANAVTWTAAGP